MITTKLQPVCFFHYVRLTSMNYIIIHLEVCEFPAKLQQVQWPQSTITLLCTPFFLFSAPIFSLLRTPFFLFSATLFLFSAPIVLFSAPFFLFSAPLIVVALLARMQSYSVNSLGVLECNHRLWVAIHVSRIQTSAWRLTGIMSLQFHVVNFCIITVLLQVAFW